MIIKFNKLSSEAIIPRKANRGDAGYDLYSIHPITIGPLKRSLVSTGIAMEIPSGYYGKIAPRSGLALDRGIDVLGGIIDSSYRGGIGVILINLNLPRSLTLPESQRGGIHSYESLFGDRETVSLPAGSKIAQLIIHRCYDVTWEENSNLSISSRGEEGFGSTGQ